LADRLGILPEYLNYNATQTCVTSDETREALLRAMGVDAPDEASGERLLKSLDFNERGRLLEPVCVHPVGHDASNTIRLRTHAPAGDEVDWLLELTLESGLTRRLDGRAIAADEAGAIEIALQQPVESGYHQIDATVHFAGRELHGRQCHIVTPDRCVAAAERSGGRRLCGMWTNLYSLRSGRNWGVGDFGDLQTLVEWSATVGLDFIGLNPLHALRNRGSDVSPYRPVSRLFRNEIYLDVDAIPELAECAEIRRRIDSPPFRAELSRLRDADVIDYDAVFSLKRSVLRDLHAAFDALHARADTPRGRDYRSYLEREGAALLDFATFTALDERFRFPRSCDLGHPPPLHDWREWPAALRDPRSPEVERFRRDRAKDVGFHCFVQFELDRRLAAVASLAKDKGMAIGLFQDLAIGTAPDGADPWTFPGLFTERASIGAPPDDLGPTGQNWALPPINPHRLRKSAYEYWRRLLRGAFAHAGALRIDHVMGLLRQFWIPQGCDGTRGAYVRFPGDDLFAILALESRRSGAVVIGEDLGTLPLGFSELLERWGVLSTRVLYFERDHNGEFRPPHHYSNRAYVVVATHDMVPLAGFRDGRDLMLRRRVGVIADDAALAKAQAQRGCDFDALIRRLRADGLLTDADSTGVNSLRLCAAVNRYLRLTSAPLVGISLDDLAGETEPVNLPGVGQDRYRNWSRRMRVPLEELCASQEISRSIGIADG
jgi:4-alpha-glucanotransferase